MTLHDISITNYKNIASARLTLSPKINCLIGRNGMGKTNFLDAIYYLSFCRSAANPVDSQCITHGEEFFVVEGDYLTDQGDRENIFCGLRRGSKKHFKRNKKEYRRLSQHIGLIPLVLVSPADAALIGGGGEERRRFMDVVISQCDRTYLEALTAYNKALQQRNALLRMDDEPDPELMSIWEGEMARQGEVVFHKREEFVGEFIPVFQQIYQLISQGREAVSLRYVSHGQRGPLLDVIQRDRMKDRAVGYSLHGVHRDELEMLIDGYPMKREGSQGQNKTFTLALKLAQFGFLKRTASGTTPLLLLDDIFDKLDADRVERIVTLVGGDSYGQIFITDTNRGHLDSILQGRSHDYKIFAVDGGSITERAE